MVWASALHLCTSLKLNWLLSVSHLRNQPNGISDLQNAVARQ